VTAILTRQEIERWIDFLIGLLDEVDGDADLEDGDEDEAVDDDGCDDPREDDEDDGGE
jgi:hypothetical protein